DSHAERPQGAALPGLCRSSRPTRRGRGRRAVMDARAAMDDALDLVIDPRVGIIAELESLPAEPGAPDFAHFSARTSDPSPLRGHRGPFTVTAAGLDQAHAAARAASRALARYCAGLYERDGLPLAAPAEANFRTIKPTDFALYSVAQYDEPGFPYVEFESGTPV